MFRKSLSLIVAFMLAMLMPLAAVADTQHTLSVIPGDILASEEAVADLLEVLDLRITEGERSGALTVLLNEQPMVTLGLTADTTGLYAASEVLGQNVLYVTWDDAFAMLTELMKSGLSESGAEAAEIEALEASMAEAKSGIIAALGAEETGVQPSATADMEQAIAMIGEMFPDDPAMIDYIKGVYEGVTIEDGSFTGENRDAADQKWRMTMDETHLLKVCETAYMRNAVIEGLTMENESMTEEELNKAADEIIAETKELFENSDFEMIMEMFTLDAGETLVGLDMSMTMTIKDAEESVTMQMKAVYDRLTDAQGVSHKADADITADGQTIDMLFEMYDANDEKGKGMLGVLVEGEEIVIAFETESTAADTSCFKADLFMRSGASAILAPSASDRPLIGIEIVTEPADEATLAALESASPATSVDVLKLSEEEMQSLMNTVSTNGMQVLYTALGQLPTSTLSLLMGSGAAE